MPGRERSWFKDPLAQSVRKRASNGALACCGLLLKLASIVRARCLQMQSLIASIYAEELSGPSTLEYNSNVVRRTPVWVNCLAFLRLANCACIYTNRYRFRRYPPAFAVYIGV